MQPKIIFGATIAFIFMGTIAQTPATAVQSRPNGQILQIDGEVQLQRSDGRVLNPAPGMPIYPGDRLLTADGGQAILQCANLSIESVSGDRSRNLCPANTEPECDREAVACAGERNDELFASNPNKPYIISPRRTALLSDRPTLRWNRVADVTQYTVILQENSEKLWQVTTTAAEIDYPADKPPLQPGSEYSLVVITDTGVLSFESPIPGGLGFRLLEESAVVEVREAQQAIEAEPLDEGAKALAIAYLYSRNDLIAEAIDILEDAIVDRTATAYLHRWLGELYWEKAKLKELAQTHYCQAMAFAPPEDREIETEAIDRVADECAMS
ncbi:MAG: hypothetical protein SWY16_22700 [Cyanobacteriota bacterium]|nr:hypothetical protein [Cyanobacteriota bacterium]